MSNYVPKFNRPIDAANAVINGECKLSEVLPPIPLESTFGIDENGQFTGEDWLLYESHLDQVWAQIFDKLLPKDVSDNENKSSLSLYIQSNAGSDATPDQDYTDWLLAIAARTPPVSPPERPLFPLQNAPLIPDNGAFPC